MAYLDRVASLPLFSGLTVAQLGLTMSGAELDGRHASLTFLAR